MTHIIDGEFQSDKYPTCPRGKVPLSVKDKTAQDLLWEYAQRRPIHTATSSLRCSGAEMIGAQIFMALLVVAGLVVTIRLTLDTMRINRETRELEKKTAARWEEFDRLMAKIKSRYP